MKRKEAKIVKDTIELLKLKHLVIGVIFIMLSFLIGNITGHYQGYNNCANKKEREIPKEIFACGLK